MFSQQDSIDDFRREIKLKKDVKLLIYIFMLYDYGKCFKNLLINFTPEYLIQLIEMFIIK